MKNFEKISGLKAWKKLVALQEKAKMMINWPGEGKTVRVKPLNLKPILEEYQKSSGPTKLAYKLTAIGVVLVVVGSIICLAAPSLGLFIMICGLGCALVCLPAMLQL